MDTHKYSIEKLNKLLEHNYDAEKNYARAAEDVENDALKKYFQYQATKRSKFATELTTEILGLGGNPIESGKLTESLQRSWMDFKNAIAKNDEEAILKECKRVDKAALDEYKEVIATQDVTTTSKNMLEKQKASIEATLNKINSLEDVSQEYR